MSLKTINNSSVGQVRREDILHLAALQFAENGYANTDLQLIADSLGLGKATIYRQFGSKEDLFMACLDRGLDMLNEHLLNQVKSRADRQKTFRNCKDGIKDFLSYFDEHPELVELLMQGRSLFRQRAQASYRKYWEYNSSIWMGRLQTSIDEGRIRETQAGHLLDIFNDVLFGAIFTRYFGKPDSEIESTSEAIADVLMHGALTESHRKNSSSLSPVK
jgi:AcrR family transcriptional regulator